MLEVDPQIWPRRSIRRGTSSIAESLKLRNRCIGGDIEFYMVKYGVHRASISKKVFESEKKKGEREKKILKVKSKGDLKRKSYIYRKRERRAFMEKKMGKE